MSRMPPEFILLVEQIAHACDDSYRRGFCHGHSYATAGEGEGCSIMEWMLRRNEDEIVSSPPPVPSCDIYPNKDCVEILNDFKHDDWVQLNILLNQYMKMREEDERSNA